MSKEPVHADDGFRHHRQYLPDDAFAYIEGEYTLATDLIPKQQWSSLMSLPDDVVLWTTDHQGSRLAQLHDLWGRWGSLLPIEPEEIPFMHGVGWDASDDFNAANFMAAHGYYRQAMASLRSALEIMTIAAAFAVRNDEVRLNQWRDGNGEPPKFGNARDHLQPTLGLEVRNILKDLHGLLSGYHHGQADAANAAIWQSNGPVWSSEAFTAFYTTYHDTMAMCLLMLCVGWPGFRIPSEWRDIFNSPKGVWNGLESPAIDQWFQQPSV